MDFTKGEILNVQLRLIASAVNLELANREQGNRLRLADANLISAGDEPEPLLQDFAFGEIH